MSWNDGVSKELSDFLESVGKIGGKSKEAIKEQVDIEAEAVKAALERTAPRGKTGGLLRSLAKAEVTTRLHWYGYRLEFEGNDPQGVPYQKIANVLNFGSSTIQGTRFISKAIRKLRGMDNRIAERFENVAKNISDNL